MSDAVDYFSAPIDSPAAMSKTDPGKAVRLPRQRIAATLVILGLLGLGFGLRTFQLGDRSLTWDEGHTYRWATMPPAEMIEETTQKDFNPPLYYLSLHYWVNIFGTSEWSMRLFSVIPSTLAVLIVFLLGRKMYDMRVGLLGATLMAVSEFSISYAREARSYSLMLLLATLTMYFCYGVLKSGAVGWIIAYVLTSAALAYTHPYGIFYIAAHNLTFAAIWLMHRTWLGISVLRWTLAQAALLLLLMKFLLFATRRADAVREGFWITKPQLNDAITAVLTLGGGTIPTAIMVLLFLAAVVRFKSFQGRLDRRQLLPSISRSTFQMNINVTGQIVFLLIWLATPIVVPFVLSHVSTPIFSPRYTIGAMGALFLLAAMGLGELFRKPLVGSIVLALLLVHQLNRVQRIWFEPRGEPWRDAVAFLDATARPGDHLYFYGHFPGAGYDLFRYYTSRPDDLNPHPLPTGFKAITDEQAIELHNQVSGHDRVWLIASHQKDPKRLLQSRLAQSHRTMKPERSFDPLIEIVLFTNPEAPGRP